MDEKKIREAIEYLSGYIYENKKLMETHKELIWIGEEACNTAIEALGKQLPKKPKMKSAYKDFNGRLICYKGFCPSCGEAVESYRNESCHYCTQMLDWSE